MKKNLSKRYKKLMENQKEKKMETIEDAIAQVKKNCTTKFDESIDASFLLNMKLKKKWILLFFYISLCLIVLSRYFFLQILVPIQYLSEIFSKFNFD